MYYLLVHDSVVEEVDRGENSDERSNCSKILLLLFSALTILEKTAEGSYLVPHWSQGLRISERGTRRFREVHFC